MDYYCLCPEINNALSEQQPVKIINKLNMKSLKEKQTPALEHRYHRSRWMS